MDVDELLIKENVVDQKMKKRLEGLPLTVEMASRFGIEMSNLAIMLSEVPDDVSDAEIATFIYKIGRTGLNPLSSQIYFVTRYDKRKGRSSGVVQTGIDGYRLIADRTGRYAGCDDIVYNDGKTQYELISNKVKHPDTATATVYKLVGDMSNPIRVPFTATAEWNTYNAGTYAWDKMAFLMLGKCLSMDTEILTTEGFERMDRFGGVKGKVLEVFEGGVRETDSKPFKLEYDGDMVCLESDMLNFCVTPNHDMVTTVGKIEASVLYNISHSRGPLRIPMLVPGNGADDSSVSDEDLRLLGYVIADASIRYNQCKIEVSRQYKIDALSGLASIRTYVRRTAGDEVDAGDRIIRTNFDKVGFVFDFGRVSRFIDASKVVNVSEILKLSQRQARIVFDAWVRFDGHRNKKTGVRRLYTSREDHLRAAEVIAVHSGYSVGCPKERSSDISSRPSYSLTVSEVESIKVTKSGGDSQPIHMRPNGDENREVWCVTVPSGIIIARRNGFSMVIGNCAEALALRKAFPAELSGIYTAEEMEQANVSGVSLQEKATTGGSDPEVKNPNAAAVLKRARSLGIGDDDDGIIAFLGCTIAEVENDKSGTDILRNLWSILSDVKAGKMLSDAIAEHLAAEEAQLDE